MIHLINWIKKLYSRQKMEERPSRAVLIEINLKMKAIFYLVSPTWPGRCEWEFISSQHIRLLFSSASDLNSQKQVHLTMCLRFLELFFDFRDNTVDIVIDLIISLDWIKKLGWQTQNDRNSQRCSGNGNQLKNWSDFSISVFIVARSPSMRIYSATANSLFSNRQIILTVRSERIQRCIYRF